MTAGTALTERVLDLTHALRRAGVPVAVSDDLDALRAMAAVDLLDRAQLHEALAATMVKSPGHRVVFDRLFEVYFPARPGISPTDENDEPRDIGDFLADVVQRVMDGDDAALRALALEAVSSYGGVEGRDGQREFFSYRVFRQINLQGLLRRLTSEAQLDPADALTYQLRRDEFQARLQRFREEIDAEIRRRMVARRGPDDVARRLVRQLPEDVDFFRVTADEEGEMRRAVRPLARRLAARLAVRRHHAPRGRLDVRKTLRRSLSTGGVPANPAWKSRHVHRPDLLLLCDVSGSVAAFAKFTLLFCHALQGTVSRVRSFAFIDDVDEVTDLFADRDPVDAFKRLATDANLIWLDGHSDYGHAFERFHARWLDAVTPRTTVVILGDARSNYRAPNAWVLAEMRRRGRRVYWLNPEPHASWDSGDSVVREYARYCDAMVECRTLRQLSDFIETIV